jgi:hypothetical protein
MIFIKRHAINVIRGVDKSIFPKSFWHQYLVFKLDGSGIWFGREWDEILYVWPWKRNGKGKFVSLLASGTGEFGDASFSSLKELDQFWESLETTTNKTKNKDHGN